MKKVKNIFHKIANADPMIWGYVMLNETKQIRTNTGQPPVGL